MTLSPPDKSPYPRIGGERQFHLRDVPRVLGSHWRVVAFLTVLVVFAAYTQARRTLPRYQSELSVQVNAKQPVSARKDDTAANEIALRTDPVLSEALVLSTQRLALTVVDSLGLRLQFQKPETWRAKVIADVRVDTRVEPGSFVLRLKGPAGYEVRNAASSVVASGGYDTPVLGPGFSFRVQPYQGEPYDAPFAIVPRDAAAALVSGGLSYDVQGSTNSIRISYQGTDSTLVPEILNAAAIALREYGANRTRELADQRLTYIRGQTEQAAELYRRSLGELQRYRERQALTYLTAQEIATVGSLQDFEHRRQRGLAEVASLRGALEADTSVSIEAVNRLAAIPGLGENSALSFQIQNVLKLYDERHTMTAGALGRRGDSSQVGALDDRIAHGATALREAAHATLGAMEGDGAALDRQIAELRARLRTFPGKESRFAQLAFESELLHDTHRYLLTQYQAAAISAATIHPYVEIMDAAANADRVGVGMRQKLLIGLLVGLFLGILAAFLLEYLDQTIKTSSDLERILDVPVLGLIPLGTNSGKGREHSGGKRRGAIPLVSLASPEDPSAEAYRAFRTNVTFVNAEERALRLLCVTSPGPGEGKSTTAANLAITLAQQGTHVLLVDADLRRPIVHRAFNFAQEPGLTDILAGSATLREAARPNVVTKLDVLPAGALPPNPSELLGSAAMHRLLEQLRAEYDMVVFDSPPALTVTDSTVLGASTDGMIIVVRSGETEEAAAQQTLAQLRRGHARVAGAVLNGIAKQADRYYYYEHGGAARKAGLLAALRSRLADLL